MVSEWISLHIASAHCCYIAKETQIRTIGLPYTFWPTSEIALQSTRHHCTVLAAARFEKRIAWPLRAVILSESPVRGVKTNHSAFVFSQMLLQAADNKSWGLSQNFLLVFCFRLCPAGIHVSQEFCPSVFIAFNKAFQHKVIAFICY